MKGRIGAAAIMMLTCTAFGMIEVSAVEKPEKLEVTGKYTYTGEEITVEDKDVQGYNPKEMNMTGNKSSKAGAHEISVTPKEGNWDGLDNADAVTAPWTIDPAEQVISLISGKGVNGEKATINVAMGVNISAEEMKSKITKAKGKLSFVTQQNLESSAEESETIEESIGILSTEGEFTSKNKLGKGKFEVFAEPVYVGEDLENTHKMSNKLNVTLQVLEKVTIKGLEDSKNNFTYNGNSQKPEGTVTVSEDKIPANELEILYEGTGETEYPISKDAPKNAGTYKVTYSVPNTNETYAGSTSYEFKIERAEPEYTVPQNLKGVKGQKLGTVELTENWKWKNPETVMEETGEKSFNAIFTPQDIVNYTEVEKQLSVQVSETENVNNYPEKPTLSVEGKYTYKGNNQTATVNGYNSETMLISGNVQKDAGDYEILVTPKEKWSDGTTDEVKTSWKIEKADSTNYTIPTNLKAKIGQKLSEINLPEGFVWANPETEILKTDAFFASFTINGDTKNYNPVNDIYVMVKINDPNIKTYPLDDSQDKSLVFKKNSKIEFKINANYDLFANGNGKVFIDGLFIKPEFYSSKSGSTIITLTQPFADSLSVGPHSLTVTFSDGAETNLSFSINNQNLVNKDLNNTNFSNDNSHNSNDSLSSNINQNLFQSLDDDSFTDDSDFIQTDDSFSFVLLSISLFISSCSLALLHFLKRFSLN